MKYKPGGFLVMAGDGCPGSGDYNNALHDHWFDLFYAILAHPSTANLDDMPSRDASAMVIMESERRFVESAQHYDGVNSG